MNLTSELRRRARDFEGWRPVQQIEEGTMLLPLHGIAYRRWQDAGAMTAVMPLNVLWSWSRRFYVWMRFQAPGGMLWLDDKLFEAYNLGHRQAAERYRKSTTFRRYGNVVERGETADVEYTPSGIGGGR